MKNHLAILITCLCSPAWGSGLSQSINSWTGQVYLAIIGDSIPAGGGTISCGSGCFPRAITNSCRISFSYTNGAVGSACWTNMESQLDSVLAKNPRVVLVSCGRNDVLQLFPSQSYPGYWPTIQNCLSNVYAKCQAKNAKLILAEVLPYCTNEFGIPTVHGYNGAYSTWTATNAGSSTLIDHDAFGVGPGYDALNPAYWNSVSPQDCLHVNQAAYDRWGTLVSAKLNEMFPDVAITCGWTHSTSTNVVAYKVYWGPSVGNYTNHIDVGYVTTATITNVTRNTWYWLAGTAVDANGLESDFSNEVSVRVPNKPNPPTAFSASPQ